ncbi:hypothetical protein HHI36_002914 [Cryptolaemus montrouzieri]|uniref:DUF3456 domain-containing protein n=1 Tax=Cryptolaemus montrouzieri TaxID=559131 RepID=A0ABD2PBU6_9CUCU
MEIAYFGSFLVLIFVSSVLGEQIDSLELKCLVCEASIEEMKEALGKIDPSSLIDVGGYQLDENGNYKSSKVIAKSKSEIHLSEVIDEICGKMENYVRATWKTNGTLTLLNLLDSAGGLNSKMSEVDIIQDSDLNKSLLHYCSSIMEENEDEIIEYFQEDNVESICSSIGLCRKIQSIKEDL